jgi:hypothetical protein
MADMWGASFIQGLRDGWATKIDQERERWEEWLFVFERTLVKRETVGETRLWLGTYIAV